ncbi:hypothetical protein [Streptomyces cavernicola]|uniref:DUF3592 domain-containing protein n=1 Tax=Streptomyces cavernicola TaxID=3043613 RepID=A0ABT6SGU6_9ACTN|nr:hypothetical protein [Streptomyces sp. B-S-A6]MDI3407190.1 hypothetical protein [Streptomyces sp. B-S-A6]
MTHALGRLGGAVFLILGLLLSGYSTYEGVYAAGLAGTAGTLKVTSCESKFLHNASRRSRRGTDNVRCHGTFAPAAGNGPRDSQAYVDTRRGYPEGALLDVQQGGPALSLTHLGEDRDYVATDAGRALRWFSGTLGGLVLIGLGVFCTATGYAPFGRSEITYESAWERAGRSPLRRTVIGFLAVGLVGAGLCWLASLFA